MGTPLRLALLGLGPQGLEHLQASAGLSSIVFVAGVDPSASAHRKVADVCPWWTGRVLGSIDELNPTELDGLVLALPHHVYETMWPQILALGKPMLKEKPFARDLREAQVFKEQARLAGCPIQVAIQRRYHPSYSFLRERMHELSAVGVMEVHAHMHLGFAPQHGSQTRSWRDERHLSGGGALLDAGYHLVDLLLHLVGPLELVACTLTRSGHLCGADDIEDRAHLLCRNERCWVSLDSWRGGMPQSDQPEKLTKSEGVEVRHASGGWFANRVGVWDEADRSSPLIVAERDWSQAMRRQLDGFAERIHHGRWEDPLQWDQWAAMGLIEKAYQQAQWP